jgi:hypothetical protein
MRNHAIPFRGWSVVISAYLFAGKSMLRGEFNSSQETSVSRMRAESAGAEFQTDFRSCSIFVIAVSNDPGPAPSIKSDFSKKPAAPSFSSAFAFF